MKKLRDIILKSKKYFSGLPPSITQIPPSSSPSSSAPVASTTYGLPKVQWRPLQQELLHGSRRIIGLLDLFNRGYDGAFVVMGAGSGKSLPMVYLYVNRQLKTTSQICNTLPIDANILISNYFNKKLAWLLPHRVPNQRGAIDSARDLKLCIEYRIGEICGNHPNPIHYNPIISQIPFGEFVEYYQEGHEGKLIAGCPDNIPTLIQFGIYESMGNRIAKNPSEYDIIVFDEVHEAFPEGTDNDKRSIQICTAMVKIIKAISKLDRKNRPKIIFITATINERSVAQFCQFIESAYGLKIYSEFIRPEPQKVSLKVIPDPILSKGYKGIVEISKKIMKQSNVKGQLILLFSLKQIVQLTEELIRSFNPIYHTEVPEIAKIRSGDTVRIGFRVVDLGDLLREALMRGFCFLTGQLSTDNADVAATLFSSGRAKLCIATDTVGTGVNLSVQNIYLSSINKYSDGKEQPIPIRVLYQILNRAGRGKFYICNIYVRPEDVEYVTRAMLMDPTQDLPYIDVKSVLKYAGRNKVDNFFRNLLKTTVKASWYTISQ